MKLLLIPVFLISIIFFISIPDAFGGTYLVNVPMGAAGGVGNFEPNITKIEEGDTIKWSIYDRGTHSVTEDYGLFDSGTLEANRAGSTCFPDCKPFTYTFHDAGTYDYHCKFHSWMQGSVIVGGLGSTASVKDCGNVGCVYLDNQQYEVSEGRTVLVKIYGNVNDNSNTDFVFMAIKEPSGKLTEHRIPVTSTGDFVYPLPISYDKRGMYDVIVRAEYNPNGSQLGSIWFEVVKTSTMSQQKEITPTSIILSTDSQRYEKGSIIGIAGQLIPYQSESFDVTIKVIHPTGNIVQIDQIRPSSTGTFESTVNTSSWSTIGNYEIKAKYENLIKSTSFAFTIPSSSTSKTSTFLKLDSLDNTFKPQVPNTNADVTFSGQLLTGDRNTHIPNTSIKLVFTGITVDGKDHYTTTTNSDGKFKEIFTIPIGRDYGIQAVFDGDTKFKSSKSQTEYFTVTLATSQPQPQPPTQSSGGFEWIWILIILGVVFAGVAAVLAKRNKKKTPIAPLAQQPKRRRAKTKPSRQYSPESASTFAHYECPNCHSENIVQNPDGSELCSDCGWKS